MNGQTTGSLSSTPLGAVQTNPRKNVQVQEVDNGFIVTLGYGQGTKIAKDKEEVLQFISEFLNLK